MSLQGYLAELEARPQPAETELYGTLDAQIMRDVLGYPAGRVRINMSRQEGVPDLTLMSDQDERWVVGEVKLDDGEIRDERRRERLWTEQVAKYIEPDTMYVCLIGPRTIYLCDLAGQIVQGVHLDAGHITDHLGEQAQVSSDPTLRRMLQLITYEEACSQAKYDAFRRGQAVMVPRAIGDENLPRFRATIQYALQQLEPVLREAWQDMHSAYEDYRRQAEPVEEMIQDAGDDPKARADAINRLHGLTLPLRDIVQVIEQDWPAFLHSQSYAGTKQGEHFLSIFITDTAYIILSRLLFVRLCEDLEMVSPKVSHRGVKTWQDFMGAIPTSYRDMIHAAFRATEHVYSGLFERSVFDWWPHADGKLSAALERILYRLSGFVFTGLSRDVLGDLYQNFLPPAKRKQLGEFYTDTEIVDYILNQTGITGDPRLAEKKVLDPACGSFTFGVRIAHHLLAAGDRAGLGPADQIERLANVLVGFDVNPFAVFIAQMNLIFAVLPLYKEAKDADSSYILPYFHVYWLNSLLDQDQVVSSDPTTAYLQPQCLAEAYDYVVGNPPYVRNERIPEADRETIERAFANIRHKNTDLAAYFVYRALTRWLKPDGVLGFVVSLGLANSSSTNEMRNAVVEHTLTEITSLEWIATSVFKGTDIVPMLLLARRGAAAPEHALELVQGIRSLEDFRRVTAEPDRRVRHLTRVGQRAFVRASRMGQWCPELQPEDLPLLARLQDLGTVQSTASGKAQFGIKAGKGSAGIVASGSDTNEPTIQYCKGEAVTTWGCSASGLELPLSQIGGMADASLWKNLVNNNGQNALAYDGHHVPEEAVFLAEVHPTLCACVERPHKKAINNSAIVVVPANLPAHALCAVINSMPSRYLAFLAFRSAVLLRRRATWYPRTVDNLPVPTLSPQQIGRLEELSRQAHQLSLNINTAEADLWAQQRDEYPDTIRAAQLLDWTEWTEGEAAVTKLPQRAENDALRLTSRIRVKGDEATLNLLLWTAQLHLRPKVTRDDAMNVLLPRDTALRQRLAEDIATSCAQRPQWLSILHDDIEPEIDGMVLEGLGLGSAQRKTITDRCAQFPLSDTVGRPRYLWSEDRKKQALRRYDKGTRFTD